MVRASPSGELAVGEDAGLGEGLHSAIHRGPVNATMGEPAGYLVGTEVLMLGEQNIDDGPASHSHANPAASQQRAGVARRFCPRPCVQPSVRCGRERGPRICVVRSRLPFSVLLTPPRSGILVRSLRRDRVGECLAYLLHRVLSDQIVRTLRTSSWLLSLVFPELVTRPAASTE